jgi:hypothetical protein
MVVDPHRYNADPDPVKKFLKKFTAWKVLYLFLIKNCNLLIPRRIPWRTHKLQEKPSVLKREHTALKNMKFFTFFYICGSLLPSSIWILIRIQNMDPDPVTLFNADPCGSGSTTVWASNVDPDPHEFGPLDPAYKEISCFASAGCSLLMAVLGF